MNEVHVPDWVGQTYFKPPQCSHISSQYETNDNMKCNLGIPMPIIGAYSESFKEHESYGKVFNDGSVTNMPGVYSGNDLYTAVADMNNDGYIDIVIGNTDKNSRVVLNNGYGLFIDPPILIYNTLGNFRMTCIALADMNDDGYVDVVIGNRFLGNSLVMNNGDETFADPPMTLPGSELSTKSIALADMNNDGYIDIVVGNDKESNHVLINNGNGVINDFPIQLPGGNGSTRSIALADMNNDGYIDIIIGTPFDKMNKIVMNNGN